MRRAEHVKRLIKNLTDRTSAEMDERVLGDVLRALAESQKTTSAITKPNIRRTIMKSPITKLAAAAVITIIVIAIIHYVSGPINIAAPAFADMMEEIYKARTVTYKETFYPGESREFTTTEMIIESGIMRSEMPHGDIMISDFSNGKDLQLVPNIKRAILTQRVGRPKSKKLFNYLDWVSRIHEDEGKFTGQEEVSGKMTNVFVVEMPFETTTVWVDPGTNLPVRVEMVTWLNPNKDIIVPEMSLSIKDFGGEEDSEVRSIILGSGRGSPDGIQKEMTIVLSDFVWNEELDESLFSLEPPEGYTIEERQFDVSDTGENSLIQSLAFWAEMSGGMFPSKINDLGDPNIIRPMLVAKFDRNGDPAEELDQAMKQLHIILKGLFFAQERKVDGSWYYAGDGVKLGDADAPLCRWKSKGSENYRVMYGDLSLVNLSAEKLSNFP